MMIGFGAIYSADVIYGGTYKLTNPVGEPVTKNGISGRYRLRIYNQFDGVFVREIWTNEDGTWEIPWISGAFVYFGVAFDHDANLNTRQDGIVRTYLTAELM